MVPIQTGNIKLALNGGNTVYGVTDSPTPKDYSAIRIGGNPGPAGTDQYTYQPADHSLITSRSISPAFRDLAEGKTLYYDPIYAAFGPSYGDGLVSWVVSTTDSDASTKPGAAKVSCELDSMSNLQCAWGDGDVAEPWFCGGTLALVAPGVDASSLVECNVGAIGRLSVFEFTTPAE